MPVPQKNKDGEYSATLGDLITYTKDLQLDYNECAIRNDSLVDLITKENERIREINNKLKKQ